MTDRMKPTYYQLPTGRWAVVDVPNDWRDGDVYPEATTKDGFFNTEAEAVEEFKRRLSRPPASAMAPRRFLNSSTSIDGGLELVKKVINDDGSLAAALRLIDEWRDALLLFSAPDESTDRTRSDALYHLMALREALVNRRPDAGGRIESLERRLRKVDVASEPR